MGKRTARLRNDVEDLVKKSTVEEASAQVWQRFDNAMSQLSPESQEWLSAHFDGTTIEELSHRTQLKREEVMECVERAKRQLLHYLRTETRVKQ